MYAILLNPNYIGIFDSRSFLEINIYFTRIHSAIKKKHYQESIYPCFFFNFLSFI